MNRRPRELWRWLPALGLGLLLGCGGPRHVQPTEKVASEDGIEPRSPAPIFEEVAARTGLRFEHQNGMTGETYFNEIMGAGAALFDYDGDGDLDVYLVQGGSQDPATSRSSVTLSSAPSDRLLRNEIYPTGELRFVDVTDQAGLEHLDGYGMGVATGDYDNDGWVDLYVTNYGANQLLRNRGDGTFEEINHAIATQDSGWSTSAAFADFDGDDWLDLLVINYVDYRLRDHRPCRSPTGRRDYCGPQDFQGQADRLLRNRGDGTFEDISEASGIARYRRPGLGAISADLDLDGWLDVYVGNDLARNSLWLNGGGTFEDLALLRGCAVNADGHAEASMGMVAADLDNDGDEDLFATHLRTESNTLFRNDGGFFTDASNVTGLGPASAGSTGFGTVAADFDHNGWLDLAVANGSVTVLESQLEAGSTFPLGQPNQLFMGRGDGSYELVPSARAGDAFAENRVSRGMAAGDIDNDGDMDLLVTHNNGPAQLLLNRQGNERAWIGLRLIGGAEVGGRDLLGAWVSVAPTVGDRAEAFRRVRSDGSYCSASDPRVHFGLGNWHGPVRVEVSWPGGRRERWPALDTDRYHTLVRGGGETL